MSFPLNSPQMATLVKRAWHDLGCTTFGSKKLSWDQLHRFPGQAVGCLFEQFLAMQMASLDLAKTSGHKWRPGYSKTEKDIFCTTNPLFSVEVKTSSSSSGIYGNRSSTRKRDSKRVKVRSGYYVVVNWDKDTLKMRKARFGYIDDSMWVGQASDTGQQAYVPANVAKKCLVDLPIQDTP